MIQQLGSIIVAGERKWPNSDCQDKWFTFGDTPANKEGAIPFIEWKGNLVATSCVCRNMSWNTLDALGFIAGHPIKIDGQPYLCRSLCVTAENYKKSEWENILADLGKNSGIWKNIGESSWAQDVEPLKKQGYTYGLTSPTGKQPLDTDFHSPIVGFRPILEPLAPAPKLTQAMIGNVIEVYGPGATVRAILADFDNYDIVLQPTPGTTLETVKLSKDIRENKYGAGIWLSMGKGEIFANRTLISWFKVVDWI